MVRRKKEETQGPTVGAGNVCVDRVFCQDELVWAVTCGAWKHKSRQRKAGAPAVCATRNYRSWILESSGSCVPARAPVWLEACARNVVAGAYKGSLPEGAACRVVSSVHHPPHKCANAHQRSKGGDRPCANPSQASLFPHTRTPRSSRYSHTRTLVGHYRHCPLHHRV